MHWNDFLCFPGRKYDAVRRLRWQPRPSMEHFDGISRGEYLTRAVFCLVVVFVGFTDPHSVAFCMYLIWPSLKIQTWNRIRVSLIFHIYTHFSSFINRPFHCLILYQSIYIFPCNEIYVSLVTALFIIFFVLPDKFSGSYRLHTFCGTAFEESTAPVRLRRRVSSYLGFVVCFVPML